jgi:hypothetical protein
VDGATDRVYQYTGAATRTSGSQSAATSFPLAPGNTNPQGIADPPAGGTSEFAAASFSIKGLPATDLAALARSVAPVSTTQPPRKRIPAVPAAFLSPVAPQNPPQAVDEAVAALFEADEAFARPAAHKPLAIELLLDDQAETAR